MSRCVYVCVYVYKYCEIPPAVMKSYIQCVYVCVYVYKYCEIQPVMKSYIQSGWGVE
jgi:hypothetical protein